MTDEIVYTLSDGSMTTASQLAKKIGISTAGARFRLNKSLDVNVLYCTQTQLLSKDAKVWVLSDGTKGTVMEFAEKINVSTGTIRSRLRNSLDSAVVLKPISSDNQFHKHAPLNLSYPASKTVKRNTQSNLRSISYTRVPTKSYRMEQCPKTGRLITKSIQPPM
ncbi:hypothetical protein [Thalassotalea piscium]|uniref:Uncharacterized protein n=1 Tax=Thalassotalea piscium TaxID=1230533 RepID=A0A7X0NGN7_9GAMM|nr:hypothetical protein [Thalassotalea piscium]MBB6543108.1 hypothetical protein [Thalassotalea piscium]